MVANDERGHVSNIIREGGGWEQKHNAPGSAVAVGDPVMRERAQKLQKGATIWLSVEQGKICAHALVDAVLKRGWRIRRAAIMANHIHVVICECPDDGEAARRILKGVSQAALSKAQGRAQRWWTAGGSDRYKHGAEAIEAAIQYVANQEHKLIEIIDNQVHIVS
jgi:REP element-mobilizing transposase RayT